MEKDNRSRQDSNLRGETPTDFKSVALTTRPRLRLMRCDVHAYRIIVVSVFLVFVIWYFSGVLGVSYLFVCSMEYFFLFTYLLFIIIFFWGGLVSLLLF